MTQASHSQAIFLLKSHALSIGDCVAVYDPELDVLVEHTVCIQEITGVSFNCENIIHQWFDNLEGISYKQFKQLFSFSAVGDCQQLDYTIERIGKKPHSLRHLSYSFISEQGNQLILMIIRDYHANTLKKSTLKVADWHLVNSSQLRHIRKLISTIYNETKADFIMVATPDKSAKVALSLATMQNGFFVEQTEYLLADTPCESTVSGKICVFKKDIQKLFPNDRFLADISAQSYVGVPFFNEKGQVNGYLIIMSSNEIDYENQFTRVIDNYQPMLNRRIQLYIADQQLSELKSGRFDHSQFLLGSTPSSESLLAHANLSEQAFNSVKEAILIADKNSNIIHVNKAFSDITGYLADDVIGKNPRVLSSKRHGADFYVDMYQCLEQEGIWEGEIINKTKQGKLYTEWLSIRAIYDHYQELTHYIAVFSDISVHKEHEKLLYFQANYDPLTSLPNRSLLFFILAEEIAKLNEKPKSTLCLMHLDLNGLSRINENYSYAVGDGVLLEVTAILRSVLTEGTTIARISGDNFIVLFNVEGRVNQQLNVAEQIIEAISKPMEVADQKFKITSNIGVAFTKDSELSTDSFYSRGEQALFKAKLDGVNIARTFDDSLKSELRNHWQTEQELSAAIENDEFVLFYQPQIDAVTNKLSGVEALVRWQHPTRGLLTPNYFIPSAEKSGQIITLGNLILQKACQQIKIWQEQQPEEFTVSVNISPKQFAVEATHHYLKRIISEADIDKSRVVLEVTEDVLMNDHDDLLEILGDFRRDGIELSLDDFGTGFSSLSYLQQYPLGELKIDRSFITSLGAKPESQTIVKAIISMAKGLRLKVVAEGVETEQHRDILLGLGCDIFQGFYYAKPLTVDNLERFIKSH